MIREFSFSAKSRGGRARAIFVICMASSFLFISASMLLDSFRSLLGVIGFGLLVGAIFVYTKYLAATYYYEVRFDGGMPLFVIRHTLGQKQTTLCRVALNEITAIEPVDAKSRREHKTPEGYNRYSYHPTMMPEECYRITVDGAYEKAEILIEINGEVASLLSSYVNEQREN